MELITDLLKTLLVDLGVNLDEQKIVLPSKHAECMDFLIEQAEHEWFVGVSNEGTRFIGKRRRKI